MEELGDPGRRWARLQARQRNKFKTRHETGKKTASFAVVRTERRCFVRRIWTRRCRRRRRQRRRRQRRSAAATEFNFTSPSIDAKPAWVSGQSVWPACVVSQYRRTKLESRSRLMTEYRRPRQLTAKQPPSFTKRNAAAERATTPPLWTHLPVATPLTSIDLGGRASRC